MLRPSKQVDIFFGTPCRGWGAAKQVTESGAFLAFLISTPHWSVWQEIKRASIEMSIQFDLKETRLAQCTFHFAQGMILIETTSDLSLVFMRGWKFVEISILTFFRRIKPLITSLLRLALAYKYHDPKMRFKSKQTWQTEQIKDLKFPRFNQD